MQRSARRSRDVDLEGQANLARRRCGRRSGRRRAWKSPSESGGERSTPSASVAHWAVADGRVVGSAVVGRMPQAATAGDDQRSTFTYISVFGGLRRCRYEVWPPGRRGRRLGVGRVVVAQGDIAVALDHVLNDDRDAGRKMLAQVLTAGRPLLISRRSDVETQRRRRRRS